MSPWSILLAAAVLISARPWRVNDEMVFRTSALSAAILAGALLLAIC